MSHSSGRPKAFRIVDHLFEHRAKTQILFPFAFEEAVCRRVGAGLSPPLVHIWRHPKAFVLGLRDRRLPQAVQAMEWLHESGYDVTVRNSGGAAVPLDLGVVNVSLILPNRPGRIDVMHDFQQMSELIAGCLAAQGIQADRGEIEGSYCPGKYDLSIDGVKFCGISQRRQTKAVIIQAFVNVMGSGPERAELVREFYRRASGSEASAMRLVSHGGGRPLEASAGPAGAAVDPGGASGRVDYPQVEARRMGSLSELAGRRSSREFMENVKEYVRGQYGALN